MKRITLLFSFLSIMSICNAQSLKELEKRHNAEVEKKKQAQVSYSRSKGSSFELFDGYDNIWGFAYDYSKDFPLALSVNYAMPYFSLGAEFGLSLNSKSYKTKETEKILELSDPGYYLTVKPGLNLEYITLACGVGFVGYTKDVSETRAGYSYSSSNEPAWGLFVKPEITGLIPICDKDYYITLHIGYNIAPKFKEINGITFGTGFQFAY